MYAEHIQLIDHVAKKDKTLILGTGPSLEVLNRELVAKLTKHFNIFCVNTSHYYFKDIDVLFIGNFCNYAQTATPEHFTNENIKFFVGAERNKNLVNATFIPTCIYFGPDKFRVPELCTDITKELSLGPTTILDLAIPTAMFCGCKQLFLLGAEYPISARYKRFFGDAYYRDQKDFGFVSEMSRAHDKWHKWQEYFKQHNIAITNFTETSELALPKQNIYEYVKELENES